ncbi:hypothetical protein BGZ93_000116 [Podila epicladia]|nr:hypothetical protein BGZ93_000116 [Podila epicladia]
MKVILLLSTLCIAQVAVAQTWYSIHLYNNDGSKDTTLDFQDDRVCYCLSETQTAKIDGTKGGDVKLFSSDDCTGKYSNGSDKMTTNAQWVNSVSFGRSGIPSLGPGRNCKCKDKAKGYPFPAKLYERICYCISKTSAYKIVDDRGGDVKMFAPISCTGKWADNRGQPKMHSV